MKAKIAIVTILLAALTMPAASAWLAVDGSPEANGWTQDRAQPQDHFAVQDGVLTCGCSPNPMKGVRYVRPIDFPKIGELTFEVRLFVSGHTERYVLPISIGTYMLVFCQQSMSRHYPVPGLKYPNWTTVGKDCIPADTWTKVRVRWNTPKKQVKFYIGENSTIPTYVDEGVTIEPGGEGYRLAVGNYGLHGDYETHQLRNLEVRAVTEAKIDEGEVERDTALVFAGLCSEYFPIATWTREFPADKIVTMTLNYNGLNYTTKNRLSLSGYPDDELCARTKLIVLCDLPLEKSVLPYSAQANLLAAVRDGARMIVTGGLAGLEKCGDLQSPIAKALPVKFADVWTLPKGGKKAVCDYGQGKIVVLSMRKAKRSHDDE